MILSISIIILAVANCITSLACGKLSARVNELEYEQAHDRMAINMLLEDVYGEKDRSREALESEST